jgi:hypothetical protein
LSGNASIASQSICARSSAVASSAIERRPPHRSNEPALEAFGIPQLPKFLMCLRERVLRNVLGILAMAQH